MRVLTEYDVETLGAELAGGGFKASHAERVLRAFYAGHGDVAWEGMTVGRALEGRLRAVARVASTVVARRQSVDGTVKLLLGLEGGGTVESVLMPAYREGRAACCVSSQIGCAMGCDFCASTKGGLERNLSASEIVEQFLHLKREAAAVGRRLTSLVFMGMGEPMHNLDNVIPAIRRIADPRMGGLGWRQVTVSTVGIVPGMDRLAEADLNVHLALSLHGADDETRSRIVPMNRKYPIADVMAAARRFYEKTRRVPTIEWCMLGGVNDGEEQARKLAGLMEGFKAHVNLIPYNSIGLSISGIVYLKPSAERVARFKAILMERGVVAHWRDTRGDDVDAACGQLRQRVGEKS
jgi:23S rRNA (adenine2503-C2)-methyltransferase